MRHRVRRHRLAGALIATLATALVAGCGAATEDNAAAPTPEQVPELHEALPQAVKDSGVLVFAGDSHPPYRTVGADGAVTGIDKDIQTALGGVLGVRPEIKIVKNLPAALQGMLSGRYNAFNGPVKATAEREQDFDTITWMTTRTSYVVPADAGGIKDSADLCGKTVAVVEASVVEEQLTRLSEFCSGQGGQPAQTLGLADTNATMLAVQSGRADAAGMTQAAAIDVTKEQDTLRYVTQTEEQGATADHLALLVPKDSGLGPVMLKAFQALFDSGDYQRIMEQWGLTDVMVDKPILNVASEQG